MTGNNKIELNGATMRVIVQHYFETVLFKEGHVPIVDEVRGIAQGPGGYTFEVSTKENKPT